MRKSLSWMASLMRFLVWKSLSTVVMVRAALLDTLCPDTPCFFSTELDPPRPVDSCNKQQIKNV